MTGHTHQPRFTPKIIPVSETAEKMSKACTRFLESLTSELRRRVMFEFGDGERQRWSYLPREMFDRRGLFLKEMNTKQRAHAFRLMASGLSQMGYEKTSAIMKLEKTLGQLERNMGSANLVRDPQIYAFSVFGEPSWRKPWGWRVEGHHVSLNFTVVARDWIVPTPFFFGSNPAEVRSGPQKGLVILKNEQDLARSLLDRLDRRQTAKAVIHAQAPEDIITKARPRVEIGAAQGLAVESMAADQRRLVDRLIHAYIDRLPDDLAAIEIKKIRDAGLYDIHFAWAGGKEPGKPHYYRLQGPFFLVEYDNTQNDANHIHCVWRHLEDDFGLDVLRIHHQESHAT
jgi:hypothetical protein